MSDQGNWGPPPGGGHTPPPGDDPEARDSAEDLTVPRTMALDAQQLRDAGISAPGMGPAAGVPPSASGPGYGAPASGPGAQPTGAQPEPKKSKKGLVIGGCAGCLFILLSICCCSGYLTYLEEGVSYSDPGDELESFPIGQGQPIDVSARWQGTGSARMRVYVDVGDDAPSTTRVTGMFGCSNYGHLELREVDETNYGYGETPAGWIQLPSGYSRLRDGGTIECQGRLMSNPPTSMRLVITERQKPSDWLDSWL